MVLSGCSKLLTAMFLSGLFFVSSCLAAPTRVTVNQASFNPTPIAIVPFSSPEGLDSVGGDVCQVINDDLESSGLFRAVSPQAFIQNASSIHSEGVRFNDWRVTGAHCLLTGTVKRDSDRYVIEFHLYDVVNGQELFAFSMRPDQKKWRKAAHMIADAVYSRVTSEAGYFDTQIIFVNEVGPKHKRTRSLVLMDRDGHNPRQLTNGAKRVITPRYSPTGKEIAYIEFNEKKVATIYLMDLQSGQSRVMGAFEGLNFAPRFSPDGTSVVMSLSKGDWTAIYTMNLASGNVTQLTPNVAIDTSPCFAPDGNSIIFSSDRSGAQQIYVMDRSGSNVRRLTFGEGSYSQPVYSPRGDMIAFTKKSKGRFYIGVMNSDGTQERMIATGYLVEAPIWSSNGRLIMYTKETPTDRKGNGGSSRLHMTDLTGFKSIEVKTPNHASDPAWSPLFNPIPVSGQKMTDEGKDMVE